MSVLYVVATPIGNLKDITDRAVKILETVDVIAAEDTRRTVILLKHLGIEKKEVTSFHKFNEKSKTAYLLTRLHAGDTVALVSDAGTPLISDPGFSLVERVWSDKIQVSPIPGASSVTAALSVCPFKCESWTFLGFLPTKKIEKEKLLVRALARSEVFVFFDSPRRIMATLELLESKCDRKVMVVREMTKIFESMYVGHSSDVKKEIESDLKGEMLCIVEGGSVEVTDVDAEKLLPILLEHHDTATAAKIGAKILGKRKQDLYGLASKFSKYKSDKRP
jgi:16S rRNA (cytidine1402-2'-O)-methyltransferase